MKEKVMLALEEPDLKARLEKELGGLDYRVARSGTDVLQSVFDEVPHVLIIDEDMEGGDGRSLALRIKDNVVLKYIPIILLVKNRGNLYRQKDERIDFYFQKDQDARHLIACIQEVISQHHNELDVNPLTHLPGAHSGVLRLEHAARSKERPAVCCLDLSDLAAFNGAYGDARGDEVIAKLGRIIRETLKKEGSPDDFVAHLGGDDFMVLTPSDLAVTVAEAIIRRFDEAIPVFYSPRDRERGYLLERNKDGILTQVPIMGVSVAIVHPDRMPHAAFTISEISHVAGELKKYMKTLPGSCYVRYQPDLPRPEGAHLEVCFPTRMEKVRMPGFVGASDKCKNFVDGVLCGEKIRTLFQPLMDLKTRRVVGYEALTRLASDFSNETSFLFTMARDAEKIKELDRLCIDCALKTAQSLPPDKKLFLNLNHETLVDPGVMKDLFSKRGAIRFKSIVIEVTEQSLLRSSQQIKEALEEWKSQGMSVAIDDMGGGAVSLRDVAVLRPEYIKFDRSLIRQIDTHVTKQQIVLSMILFANGIHATTTAEGIETKEEYETAKMCGIDLGQGYYLAKPGKAFPPLLPNISK